MRFPQFFRFLPYRRFLAISTFLQQMPTETLTKKENKFSEQIFPKDTDLRDWRVYFKQDTDLRDWGVDVKQDTDFRDWGVDLKQDKEKDTKSPTQPKPNVQFKNIEQMLLEQELPRKTDCLFCYSKVSVRLMRHV